jgi:RecB family endonuclease NucS
MNEQAYRNWLQQKFEVGTVQAQIDRANRLERYYGDLDEQYNKDNFESLMLLFRYSREDARRQRENPTQIPIEGDLYTGLQSCKSALGYYRRFRTETSSDVPEETSKMLEVAATQVEARRTLDWLERDMQAALRQVISQLEAGLEIIDGGTERSVASGQIDITAKDNSGAVVVIELKTGVAGSSAIGQISAYMGDVVEEEKGTKVRGILVAADFDKKALSAQRIIPNLSLKKYAINFEFVDA